MSDIEEPAADEEAPSPPQPAPTPYEPFFMPWRRAFGPCVKRTLAPEHANARRWWWNRLFVQVPAPTDFLQDEAALRELLATQADRGSDVLAEAKEQSAAPFATSESVERRATTMQSAVAIAASFVLAGGGLLLNSTTIRSDDWRVALGVIYAVVITSLVFSALRALRATSRILIWHYPGYEDILHRGAKNQSATDYELALAAAHLHSAGRNASNARYKVAQMRAAGHWFAVALAGLLATGLLLLAYIVAGPKSSPPVAVAKPHSELAPRAGPIETRPSQAARPSVAAGGRRTPPG
ncbi:MAG TPA: hypothetical protein VGW98_10230 [Solirubrobacteraceae bacterium]|jgi:hypothetical protein|nr:hypothetical protein [Solirubrobacteraceae bacterium]